jgi:hypothetical protein
MQVWVVAQIKKFDSQGMGIDWDLGGVFTTKEAAVEVCDQPGDAVWPVELDTFLGRPTVAAPDIIFPAAQS